ncbi:MAG: nuclear transport factor 2 family protein [Pseudomonadales bacterium]|nr:nuclear transport factor 2 family protein [Pseudomonadales bacterium]MDP6472245.1 nuclear transport factor 2 family protein [Pseudomonadales bacterium]MDP6826503.1 nuclear transport factor 2 family protein [Pseudomonadales bacterium]MDP6970688.1 nuclear transport factor 2 family protein [Pseudomonadales bacterium]|tara:strand:+ start:4073 stop:4444 length:372 start_codon:yes stop_codon:yes gene_type:complete
MADRDQIRDTVQIYFDSMFESSAEKVRRAFHPSARITGYMQGALAEMTVSDFADFVASQPSAKANAELPRLDVLSIEIAGDTAVTRVRDDYLGLTFLDTLSLLKTDGEWRIYNKLFHVEGEAG